MIDDNEITERLLTSNPITIRRRVLWGDCDPAGVVYTPRFADYAVSAAMWFIRLMIRPLLNDGVGTPMKAMHFEFVKTLRPDEFFDMKVYVVDVREHTFDLKLEARAVDGTMRFIARMTPILIDLRSFTRRPLAPACRGKLIEYRDAHMSPGGCG